VAEGYVAESYVAEGYVAEACERISPTSVEITNAWTCTSTPSCIIMLCCIRKPRNNLLAVKRLQLLSVYDSIICQMALMEHSMLSVCALTCSVYERAVCVCVLPPPPPHMEGAF
jgi:hypothetical protein